MNAVDRARRGRSRRADRQRCLGRPRRPRPARRGRARPTPTSSSGTGAARPRTCTRAPSTPTWSSEVIARARRAGRCRCGCRHPAVTLIVDPGIGFGKKGAQNWEVLRALPRIIGMGHRVLVGTSRKRFLAETLSEDGRRPSRCQTSAATSRQRSRASWPHRREHGRACSCRTTGTPARRRRWEPARSGELGSPREERADGLRRRDHADRPPRVRPARRATRTSAESGSTSSSMRRCT